jgi:hypothetical protein
LILAATRILPAVTLALPQTAGRVLAEPVRATMPLPRFDNAAMDGYAVRTSDVAGASVDAPTTLRLVAPSSAGQPTPPELPVGCACPIATGAPMPAGGDAVIMLEHAIEHGGKVLVSRPVDWGQHVRRRGEDVAVGTELLHTGQVVTAGQVVAAAALGRTTLRVRRPPRVTIVLTGTEVVPAGHPIANHQVLTRSVPPCGPCSPTSDALRPRWARSLMTLGYSPPHSCMPPRTATLCSPSAAPPSGDRIISSRCLAATATCTLGGSPCDPPSRSCSASLPAPPCLAYLVIRHPRWRRTRCSSVRRCWPCRAAPTTGSDGTPSSRSRSANHRVVSTWSAGIAGCAKAAGWFGPWAPKEPAWCMPWLPRTHGWWFQPRSTICQPEPWSRSGPCGARYPRKGRLRLARLIAPSILRGWSATPLATINGCHSSDQAHLSATLADHGRAIRPPTVQIALGGLVAAGLVAEVGEDIAHRWLALPAARDPLLDAVDLRGAHDFRHTWQSLANETQSGSGTLAT